MPTSMTMVHDGMERCQGRCRMGRQQYCGVGTMNMRQQQPKCDLDDTVVNLNAVISDAMYAMSTEERDIIYQDQHCVPAETAAEPPGVVESALLAMNTELERLVLQDNNWPKTGVSTAGLQIAAEQNREYTSNRDFRLAFLQADALHAGDAALRFLRHFNFKLKWFGKNTLCRDIIWGDLAKDEQVLLRQGFAHFLPSRDKAGRIVMCASTSDRMKARKKTMLRALFYHLSIPEPDRRLLVDAVFVMLHFRNNYSGVNPDMYTTFSETFAALPLLIVAGHLCISTKAEPQSKLSLKIALLTLTTKERARIKVHEGTLTETLYALMTFGIPHHTLPLTFQGKPKLKVCNDYLEMRRCGEKFRTSTRPSMNLILFPRWTDVLLGKGRPKTTHRGNQILKELIAERSQSYNGACPGEAKDAIIDDVFDVIRIEWRGRFLSKERLGIWEEISFDEARQKIVQSFHVHNRK